MRVRRGIGWALAGLVVAACAACSRPRPPVRASAPRPAVERRIVRGQSMTGIVEAGDTVNVIDGYYADHAPERGDVVIYDRRRPIIKVIRGIPGDRFEVVESGNQRSLFINGVVATTTRGEPYSLDGPAGRMLGLFVHDYHGVIPPNAYLILGNTPTGSFDSTRFGLVHRQDLVAKVVR